MTPGSVLFAICVLMLMAWSPRFRAVVLYMAGIAAVLTGLLR
jgi:hypothetical protein